MTRLPDYAEALDLALRDVRAVERFEMVDLHAMGSRVLAEPIRADRDLPPFNRAQMDGYALRSSEFEPGKAWPVAHAIAAGASPSVDVPPATCVAIATGAALPEGLDAVVPHESSDRGDHRGGPVRFTLDHVGPWHAVHRRGADASAGDVVIEPGTTLSAQHLGIAASVGCLHVKVRAKPRIAILTSGDEVVAPDTPTDRLQPHQIRNSNASMLRELVQRMGGDVQCVQHLPDDRNATVQEVSKALAGEGSWLSFADDRSKHERVSEARNKMTDGRQPLELLLTVGGVSVGERDHFPAAFNSCGVTASLAGASIQPGRPIFVGRAPAGTIVVGLPGNPVSALACACLFVWPIIRALLGVPSDLPWHAVELVEPVKPNANRRAFRPAILHPSRRVVVPAWAGSGDLAHTAPTHGLLQLPVQSELVPAGTRLPFLPWPAV